MQKNDILEIDIERISEDGNGIGHIPGDGRIIFCKGALPGEKISAQIIKITKSYAAARTCSILSESPDRIKPDCEFFGKCGGCSFRHYDYTAQLKAKEQHVRDCIERIGGFSHAVNTSPIEYLPIVGMDKPENYRNKAIFPFGTDKYGRITCGFYRKNSHDIIEITNCRLENKYAESIRTAVLQFARKFKLSAYCERTGKGLLRSIMIRTSHTENNAMAVIIATRELPHTDELVSFVTSHCPFISSLYLNLNKSSSNTIMGSEFIHLFGKTMLRDSILGTKFDISPMSFYQVNPTQTEKLYSAAISFAEINGGENVLDIYCGIGTIGLCLANHVQKKGAPLSSLTGIEYIARAIEDAKHNAEINGIENTYFYAGDAGEVLADLTKNSSANKIPRNYDLVILDPPRKGCDEKLLDTAVSVSPEKIVYVSCNPATLARDLKYLAEKGYAPKKVQAVDMFPYTGHVETVVLMSRR